MDGNGANQGGGIYARPSLYSHFQWRLWAIDTMMCNNP
jgi:hypothetical protein